jgi:hypothetical protein
MNNADKSSAEFIAARKQFVEKAAQEKLILLQKAATE